MGKASVICCLALLAGLATGANAQHVHELGYVAFLNGANAAPPNGSQGSGTARVLIDLIFFTMRVQVDFQGLNGQVTSAHLHGNTASTGQGVADVIIGVPTLPEFPSGGASGTYDQTISLAFESSYSPAFLAASGGTASQASNALFAGLALGQAYLDIHTDAVEDGEIRGFLMRTRPADFDFDGFVANSDLDVWKDWFAVDHFGDASGDGQTNGADLLIWQQQVGSMASLPGGGHQHLVAAPEPTTATLISLNLGLISVTARWARRVRDRHSNCIQ